MWGHTSKLEIGDVWIQGDQYLQIIDIREGRIKYSYAAHIRDVPLVDGYINMGDWELSKSSVVRNLIKELECDI